MTRTALLVAALAGAAPSSVAAEPLTGPATAVDGDTLTIGATTVRLQGIDAPEAKQTCQRDGQVWACGEAAARQLQALIVSGPVACDAQGTDLNGRTLAICRAGGLEINRALVEAGWAVAFRSLSADYVAEETRAKGARLGIWNSLFELPQDYRQANAARAAATAGPRQISRSTRPAQLAAPFGDGRCAIKGNRNRRGEWIYHVPGMPYYEATRAEEIFCSEAAARAAGYRRAIVR